MNATTTATESHAHRRMMAALNEFGWEPEDFAGVNIMDPAYGYLDVE
jgi:hypothetical protein